MTSGLLLAGAVGLLALPSAVLAFSTSFDSRPGDARNGEAMESLDGDTGKGQLARPIPLRSLAKGKLYPFTPANTPSRPDRSVTVAVRLDPQVIQAIGSKNAHSSESGNAPLRIAPTAFNLGVSRGYQNFSQSLVSSDSSRKADTPDLSRFSIAPGTGADDSRFSPHIIMDEKQATGRSPRTFAGDREDQVDVGGSYRVTRNLDVTAGVRYSQERERLLPLTDGKQDSQAVYVGTQFRF
ncbi:MAG: hypothetical protein H6917_05295 [Novosphingobium sp.]|nr:hypothetical protein [Novosphingobium sp.]MCP5401786.1 hypothetical protein [Novosphingobium sp.]